MTIRVRRPRLTERLADMLDLPKDVVMDLPRLSVIGNRQLLIENHRGIIEFSTRLIRVNTARGEVRVAGQGLYIQSISADEIAVDGRISTLDYVDWGMA